MRYLAIFALAITLGITSLALFPSSSNAGIMAPCNIVIEKEEVPVLGGTFDFDVTGSVVTDFQLRNGESDNIALGIDNIIEIREDVPDGYTLELECIEGNTNCGGGMFESCLSITPLEDGTGVRVECIDDDSGSCTFTNRLNQVDPANVPTLSEWGLIAMAGILGLIAFVVLKRKKAVA